MPRRNTRYDVKSIADRYFAEQCERLGEIVFPATSAFVPVFIPVPVTPKRNRRKRHA